MVVDKVIGLSDYHVLPSIYPQSLDYLYAKPNKKSTVVEPVVYADLSEIKKKSQPSPGKMLAAKWFTLTS